jgi:ER lumen protein retaining receptor
MRCFGLGLLNFKMWTSHSAKGVSVKTLQIYILVFVSRLVSILRHQGYLPFDKSGDWFYHIVEFVSLGSTALALYGALVAFKSTYDEKHDRFGNLHIPSQYGAAYLIGPCFLLAIIFHP